VRGNGREGARRGEARPCVPVAARACVCRARVVCLAVCCRGGVQPRVHAPQQAAATRPSDVALWSLAHAQAVRHTAPVEAVADGGDELRVRNWRWRWRRGRRRRRRRGRRRRWWRRWRRRGWRRWRGRRRRGRRRRRCRQMCLRVLVRVGLGILALLARSRRGGRTDGTGHWRVVARRRRDAGRLQRRKVRVGRNAHRRTGEPVAKEQLPRHDEHSDGQHGFSHG
jgi:hypothetical protein